MSSVTGQVRTGASLPVHRTVNAMSCRELLREFGEPEVLAAGKISFSGVGDHDVYNITAPFSFDGQTLIAGRVESRDTESSTSVIFRREGEVWLPYPGAPSFAGLQDPCVTLINGELILGGVRFPVKLNNGHTGWRMEFYRGHRLGALRRFLVGPEHMKDIRFAGLLDGRVAVFSRPQGAIGGRGKIGFALARSMDDVTPDMIESAPLFTHQFLDTEWGAANEVHVLRNGKLGVLGHIACADEQSHRHYYAMAFAVDPGTQSAGPLRIIGCRAQFPPGPSKRVDLADVIFSGGLLRHWDGTATLFAGLSDAEAGFVRIADPMSEFED